MGGRRVTTLLKSLSTDNLLPDPGGGVVPGGGTNGGGGNLPIVLGHSSGCTNQITRKAPLTCQSGAGSMTEGFGRQTNLGTLFGNPVLGKKLFQKKFPKICVTTFFAFGTYNNLSRLLLL